MNLSYKIRERSVVVENYEALSQMAADEIVQLLEAKDNCCLALATGDTPKRCYEILADRSTQGRISWKNALCFALDEYVPNYSESLPSVNLGHFLKERLYKFTDLPQSASFNPSQFDNYDAFIEKKGGWDLCLLGIGANGHIAFNEPPTPLLSFTHCVWLSDETRKLNAHYFDKNITVPSRAITVGISTVLASKKIMLIASGDDKKEILHRAFSGVPDQNVPASFLLLHDNVLVVSDFDW